MEPEYYEIYDHWYAALDKEAWMNGSDGAASVRWLPDAGGLNDQPAALLDAFTIISFTSRRLMNEIRAAARNKG